MQKESPLPTDTLNLFLWRRVYFNEAQFSTCGLDYMLMEDGGPHSLSLCHCHDTTFLPFVCPLPNRFLSEPLSRHRALSLPRCPPLYSGYDGRTRDLQSLN